jgi:ribonucleotide reductase alpha subunit
MYIISIEDHGRRSPTYCFNEPKRHMGIFNGIITGNCTEIIEYSDENETAVCNLASIGLSMFVNDDKTFNYDKLHSVTKVVTKNLDKIIDINFYPTEKTRLSNLLHRPIGMGVQGLADTFALMDIAFHSEKAREVNKLIFETIYHAALESSNEIAIERQVALDEIWYTKSELFLNSLDPLCNTYNTDYLSTLSEHNQLMLKKYKPINAEIKKLGRKRIGSYSSFEDSPASHGILQFDMWGITPQNDRYDWASLKEKIIEHGLRNSLLIAPMPTASTSQILGNNECFEPFTSNIYSRRTIAGEFIIVNKYLMKELIDIGLWSEELKDNIILNKGSIQHIEFIPQHIRDKYKIVWEIPMKHVIDMAADRGAYICQSQSLNLWMEDPDYKALTSMHFYSWQSGLKTGIYYLRRKAKHQAQQFTITPTLTTNEKILDDEPCEMCSS